MPKGKSDIESARAAAAADTDAATAALMMLLLRPQRLRAAVQQRLPPPAAQSARSNWVCSVNLGLPLRLSRTGPPTPQTESRCAPGPTFSAPHPRHPWWGCRQRATEGAREILG